MELQANVIITDTLLLLRPPPIKIFLIGNSMQIMQSHVTVSLMQ